MNAAKATVGVSPVIPAMGLRTMGIEVQAVWHRADIYSREDAANWCKDHDFKTDQYGTRTDKESDEVTHHIHRQFDPSEAEEDTWAVIADDFPEGISASVCRRKKTMRVVHTKGTQSADDPFEFIMSEESADRVGDIIEVGGWKLADFRKNPIALYGHSHDKPIGRWEGVKVVGNQLIGKLQLAKAGTSAEIDTIRSLVEQRILRAVSVSFQPIDYEEITDKDGRWTGFRFKKQALRECSLVAVPCHQNALATAKSLGCSKDELLHLFPQLRGPGHTGAPTAPRQMDEKTGAALAKLNATLGRINTRLE